jgi:hypothetical protein
MHEKYQTCEKISHPIGHVADKDGAQSRFLPRSETGDAAFPGALASRAIRHYAACWIPTR